jgi:outer membrane receptor for ferrienterochelin and colicin
LNSFGRIYTDANGPIIMNTVLIRNEKMMDDRLKFTGSIRYDKAQNFDGDYSPRLSVVYSGGQNKTIILGSFKRQV